MFKRHHFLMVDDSVVWPSVSVVMPTYRHGAYIRSALESALGQSLAPLEIIVIDDASDDDTATLLAEFAGKSRLKVIRNQRNLGAGCALNQGLSVADGELIAYLASDDVWSMDHLLEGTRTLMSDPSIYLAYGGLASNSTRLNWQGRSLLGDMEIPQADFIFSDVTELAFGTHSLNIFKMSQVVLRRTLEKQTSWTTRSERVSDQLEGDYWKSLMRLGAVTEYTGTVSCFWYAHPDQRHKIIAGQGNPAGAPGVGSGLSAYRRYYCINPNARITWAPSTGPMINEAQYYSGIDSPPLKTRYKGEIERILLVGELGFNPERLLAFNRLGIRIQGLWASNLESWDFGSLLPIVDCPAISEHNWIRQVRAYNPDVIYALLNFQAIPIIHEVMSSGLHIPVIFHFKESPQEAIRYGLWRQLRSILERADGVILVSEQMRRWLCARIPKLESKAILILDGDMPLSDRMMGTRRDKLSAADGDVHTVCVGRPVGLDTRAALERVLDSGTHLHVYGRQLPNSRSQWPNLISDVAKGDPRRSRYLHQHDPVSPERWTEELSVYDIAWTHLVHVSPDRLDRVETWADMNLPARLGTYAAAGLPWVVVEPTRRRTAVGDMARRYGIGLHGASLEDVLGGALDDPTELGLLSDMAWRQRLQFSFDAKVDILVEFFSSSVRVAGA